MPGTAEAQRNPLQERGEGRKANTYTTFTEIRRTDQETTETALFETRATRHQAHQHASLPRNNLTEITIHVCSKKYCRNFKVPLPKLAVQNNKLDLLKKMYPCLLLYLLRKTGVETFCKQNCPI